MSVSATESRPSQAQIDRHLASYDPLESGWSTATDEQGAALADPTPIVVIEGGNRAGKTRTATLAACRRALECANSTIWFATTTYDLFSQGAWPHLQTWLMRFGESVYRLPAERVKSISWIRPGLPKLITLVNGSTINVKSYDQGPGEFQAAQLDLAVVDEECPESIWREIQARFLASKAPKIIVAATPVLGVEWLAQLRVMAERKEGGVSHHRLRTLDNPAHNAQAIADLKVRFKDRPDELRLRLEGIPFYAQGLVYPDGLFVPQHIQSPFYLDPGKWSVWCCIDPGYRVCAALWIAKCRQGSGRVLLAREHYGKQMTIGENAARIIEASKAFRLEGYMMDPYAAQQTQQTSGLKIIDEFKNNGLSAWPWIMHDVLAGIGKVHDLMSARDRNGLPLLGVFSTCTEFQRERRSYRHRPAKEDGDEGKENPEKRDDHLCDCLRGFVVTDPAIPSGWYSQPPPQGDDLNSRVRRAYWMARHPPTKNSL